MNIPNLRHITFLLSLFVFLGLFISCETTEPPPSHQKLILVAEDASCTETWLNLKLDNIFLPTEISISQNDSTIITTNINSNDTTLFIENLFPNQTYIFQASRQGGQASNLLPITTMDTTMHNFSWETFTFGGGSSSYFNDVAIIDENNIWAVGEIHTEETDQFDSNGVWVKPYNAVHWDGNKWELKRIMFYSDPDQPAYGKDSSPCEAIFVFGDNNFVISSNVQIALFNLDNQYSLIKMGFTWENRFTIEAIWGTTSQDFYVIGNNGNIAHYNRSTWRKIESGTVLDIQDIWGDYAKRSDRWEVLAVTSDKYQNNGMKVFKINGEVATEIKTTGLPWSLSSLWFKSARRYIIVGDGYYSTNDHTLEWQRDTSFPSLYKHAIKGEALNSIVLCGAFGLFSYFNGVKWYSIESSEQQKYINIDIKENIIAAVGFSNSKAAIVIGSR